jgi:hypothetical protein
MEMTEEADGKEKYKFRCSFSIFDSEQCTTSPRYPNDFHVKKISFCNGDISNHLRSLKLGVGCNTGNGFKAKQQGITTEADLLSRRIGMFYTNTSMTVCPHHRYRLGVGFRQGKTCVHPEHSGKGRVFRGISCSQSQQILEEQGVLVPVGSGMTISYLKLFLFKEYDHSLVNVILI